MRTFYKQSLAALFATALALGCGSSDKQQQQAKQPSPSPAQTSSVTTTGATTEGSSAQGSTTSGMGPTMQGSTTSTTPANPPPPQAGGPQDTAIGTSSDSQNADQSASANTMPGTMDTKVTSLSDGEVLAIENAINKGEISLAELARKSSVHADVKSYAGTILTQHRDALNKSAAIAKKDKIVAKVDDVSKNLQMDVKTTTGDLKKRKGGDFDTAYIDSQVRMHRDAGTLIDNQLLPSVKNNDLKNELLGLRQTVADHQTKAQDLQSHFETVGTTSTTGATMSGSKAKSNPKSNPAPKSDTNPESDTNPKSDMNPKSDTNPKTPPPKQ